MSEIEKIDKNLAVSGTVQGQDFEFYNVKQEPFKIYGLLPSKEGEPFRRIPLELAQNTNPGVLGLHTNTAGGRVRFRTDSLKVAIRAAMPKKCLMPHMPFLGSSGFDLYEKDGDAYYYRGSFMPPVDRKDSYESVVDFGERKLRDVIINFPLYDGVDELFVGLEPGAVLEKGGSYRSELPIIYYGSSITQGGCASRPGNSYEAMITRNMDLDHVNLGFSGSGRGEQVMADYIAKQLMSVFVLDYDHNADLERLKETHEKFYLTVREKNPDLPIIMASMTDTPKTPQKAQEILARREVIIKTYENALARGDKKLLFIDGTKVFEEAGKLGIAADSCTVDGVHPNDVGFACMAKVFGEAIEKALQM